ncbi:ABC transporter permease [Mucilaginibacter ginsenosidivorax]|uniref:FtsX-like permease family protein n=1 Tax=Mucilaginibacter ginsenosidivorax TaxID=862126 RepID=A0A5B8W3S4_9SPHI|nr:ABC transporter permease [Mucilaginibacter ginsenosidivorax]QEC77536.1 FtsX-like permease family protein [Mucilaginibacter ginsenosidivorax]
MIKNYLKTALRNLGRRKSNSFVNISGLAVGFAAFLLIFLVIQYEQSFDTFHTKKNSIYRVVRAAKNRADDGYRAGVTVPTTFALRSDFQQLSNVAAIAADYNVQVLVPSANGSVAKKFNEGNGLFFTEPQFFKMFDFSLAIGNIKDALNEPNTALFTKELATKYFGDWKTAVGKTLKMDGQNIKVTGILDDIPPNTDFPIKGVLSYETMRNYADFNSWGSINDADNCFVQLAPNETKEHFDHLLNGFMGKHTSPGNAGYDLVLQPLNQIHSDSRFNNYNGHTFSKDLTYALGAIGIFLLVIACVNFINLTTAQAMNRGKEVGVRKVLGGSRTQLMMQFFGETGITCLLALIVATGVTLFCIPYINELLNIHLATTILYSNNVLLFMLLALVLVTAFSGFYPALVLSGFNSVTVLKGSSPGAERQKGISFRRCLVVFQFVIAQTLIIATLIVASQMNYFRMADLGFNKDAVINAGFPNDSIGASKMEALRNDLLKLPGIRDFSLSMASPAGGGYYTDLRTPENHATEPNMITNMNEADTSFFNLYHLQFAAGRIYQPSDTMREFVVNETVVRGLGLPNAQAAIGKKIKVAGKMLPIVGVLKDFHVNSLRDPMVPVVMTTMKKGYGMVSLKINLGHTTTIIPAMEKLWNQYFPDYIFGYNFLDQSIASAYQQENQLSLLYKIFSGIAIFISCLGLYGLISFMAVQRKKEIGIRKVLGAPVKDILVMLSKEFTILISIAFLIATPVAWYFMHQWLQHYAYRIMIGVWFFAATIGGSLIIAWLTVGYTAIKAALANPVKSLRSE